MTQSKVNLINIMVLIILIGLMFFNLEIFAQRIKENSLLTSKQQ